MCNIAGYLGDKQAAPILLEMLRKQELFDGDMSTGVATIHEGKLYYRKYVGNVDELIRETDVLDLPGTMGIAHTRPAGSKAHTPAHPCLSMDETMALVTNGTTPVTRYCTDWDKAADLLDENGYVFQMSTKNPRQESPKLSRNGDYVFPPEARLFLIDYYIKQGKTPTEALVLSCEAFYSDNITVTINEKYPDRIFALRTTRPMVVSMKDGETYMATTRFGLPEDMLEGAFDLPLFYACSVTRDGVIVSKDKMNIETVSDMTPYTYHEGYKRLEALLQCKENPLFFDDLEIAVGKMRDLWPGDHTCVQHARLVYDLLWQFEAEGRLQKEARVQDTQWGTRRRYYMWLEEQA